MQGFAFDNNTSLIKIPPFRDSHMHFTTDGKPASHEQIFKIKDNYRKYGILSVIDMGHNTGIGLDAKKFLNGEMFIRSAGSAIFKKGSYGIFLGKAVKEKEEIKSVIKDIASSGADFLKVIASGVVCSKGEGFITEGGFASEELKIIGKEARENNLEMVCHANSDSAIMNAIYANTSSIEHGFFVSKETLHMMAEAGISWTPTLIALLSLKSELQFTEKKYIEQVIENHLSSINFAASIGVKLNIGTDSGSRGVRHGVSFFDELRLFKRAGLSLEQILSAACMSAEEIEKGNFILVKKDFIRTGKIEAAHYQGITVAKE
jgi:imidazolonepropionase-like amidohydrolase